MPKLEFKDIFNRDKGKTGLVLGLGPSLGRHLSQIKTFVDHDKEKYKLISCNNMDVMTDINFDYWMLAQPADHENPLHIPRMFNRINKKGSMFLYTDCLDLTPRDTVDSLLKVPYIGYDQRHWYGTDRCGYGHFEKDFDGKGKNKCCQGIIPGRLCIQEEFMKFCGMHEHYGAGDTVGVHMVALAVMLGLNPIYITGIDLDYRLGYVNNNAKIEDSMDYRISIGMDSINRNQPIVDRILKDLQLIKDSAENIGTKIYAMDFDLKINKVFEHKRLITST